MKKLTKAAFEQLEEDPSVYPKLDIISPDLLQRYDNLDSLRKIKLSTKNHDYRMIFAHWKFDEGDEHVDILLVFRRRDGYDIDWDWINEVLEK